MEQVKIFYGTPENVESDVNDWLRANSHLYIADRRMSADGRNENWINLVFFYRDMGVASRVSS